MPTLADFQAEITRTAALDFRRVRSDRGEQVYRTKEEEAVHRLRNISRDVRRICWSYQCRSAARDLAALADREADRLCEEAGLMAGGPLPRFGEFYSAGIRVPAIQ